MNGQIILSTDPYGNANIFGNPVVDKICHNATQWMELIRNFDNALYNAMVIGIVLGFIIGAVGVIAGTWWRNRGNS